MVLVMPYNHPHHTTPHHTSVTIKLQTNASADERGCTLSWYLQVLGLRQNFDAFHRRHNRLGNGAGAAARQKRFERQKEVIELIPTPPNA
jgi:hypothetical protein